VRLLVTAEFIVIACLTLWLSPVLAKSPPARIAFSSLDKHNPINVSGALYLPENTAGPVPAIVMVHGAVGVDVRNSFYRKPILNIGVAVFEVDFKTGVYSRPFDRPSPAALVAMGFAALKELRKQPAIDPNRIGIMGFSMGGYLTINAAFEENRKTWLGDEKGFAVHVAFYPVCKYLLERNDFKVTGAPMIILYGNKDLYGDGEYVPQFKKLLKEKVGFNTATVEYAGAAHAFNRNAPALSYKDPSAIGGRGYMAWDEGAANDSIIRTVEFLRANLVAK
jgi:dienelactone hydrolase